MARENKSKKIYVAGTAGEDGKTQEGASYFADAVKLQFRFANGNSHDVDPMKFNDTVRTAAMFHGLSQKLGDAYASSKDTDEAEEKFLAMMEQLEAGNWLGERESAGPRISLVIEAIVAAKAKAGIEVSATEVAEKYNALDKTQKAGVLKDPRINAEYQAIVAARAAERAKKAAEAALGENVQPDGAFQI